MATWPNPRRPYLPHRFGQNASERLLASVLQLNLTHNADFGVFACWVSNATATFTLRRVGRDMLGTEKGHLRGGPACIGQEWQPHEDYCCLSQGSVSQHKPTPNPENPGQGSPAMLTVPFPVLAEAAGHVPAVLAALLVLVLLVLLAGLYVRCRLNMLLWYRNHYGELEINGEPPGKGMEVVPPWEKPPPGWGLSSTQTHPPRRSTSPFPHGSLQMGSCTTPTSPTPPPRMTESLSTSS